MARFDQGFIKLPRYLLREWVGTDGYAMSILVNLSMWAVFKPSSIIFKGHPRVLKVGQVLTSIKELETATGFASSTIRRKLNLLSESKMITMEASRNGSIIQINTDGWGVDWMGEDDLGDRSGSKPKSKPQSKRSAHEGANAPPASEQHNNKERKEINKKRKKDDDEIKKGGSSSSTLRWFSNSIISLFNEVFSSELDPFKESELDSSEKFKFQKNILKAFEAEPEIEPWERYFKFCKERPYLMGKLPTKDNKEPWKADLTWLLDLEHKHAIEVKDKYAPHSSSYGSLENNPERKKYEIEKVKRTFRMNHGLASEDKHLSDYFYDRKWLDEPDLSKELIEFIYDKKITDINEARVLLEKHKKEVSDD